jgi:hypothetical protein
MDERWSTKDGDESLALRIVSNELGARVEVNDDRSGQSKFDLKILYTETS